MGCMGSKHSNKLKTQCIFTQGDNDAIIHLGEMAIMRMQLQLLMYKKVIMMQLYLAGTTLHYVPGRYYLVPARYYIAMHCTWQVLPAYNQGDGYDSK